MIGILILFFTTITPINAYVLSGYVFDSSDYPLANIPTELEDDAKTVWILNKTNGSGYFEFKNLANGLYELDINNEEVIDCKVRNEVFNCHDITNRLVCENSYAEYCDQCGLSGGECSYFPCFWGDVGEGKDACYYKCDKCAFGVNQTILNNYTSIHFEDENILNLTKNLEINVTLLKIDAKLKLNSSVFKNRDTIKANVTVKNNEDFDLINWGAVLVLGFENETYSEELYFNMTPTNLSAGKTESYIFTFKIPENEAYDEFYLVGGIGTFDFGVKSSQGAMKTLAYKIDEKDIRIGKKVKFNISLLKGWNLVSIPLILTDNILPAPLKSIEGNYSHGFTYIGGKWYSYYAGEPPSYKYIDPTIGSWVNMTNDDVLEVEGYEWENPTAEFNPGWNLVGYPFLQEKNISAIFDNVSVVYSYNGAWLSYIPNKPFNFLQTLNPGYGYWVKVD